MKSSHQQQFNEVDERFSVKTAQVPGFPSAGWRCLNLTQLGLDSAALLPYPFWKTRLL